MLPGANPVTKQYVTLTTEYLKLLWIYRKIYFNSKIIVILMASDIGQHPSFG